MHAARTSGGGPFSTSSQYGMNRAGEKPGLRESQFHRMEVEEIHHRSNSVMCVRPQTAGTVLGGPRGDNRWQCPGKAVLLSFRKLDLGKSFLGRESSSAGPKVWEHAHCDQRMLRGCAHGAGRMARVWGPVDGLSGWCGGLGGACQGFGTKQWCGVILGAKDCHRVGLRAEQEHRPMARRLWAPGWGVKGRAVAACHRWCGAELGSLA